LVAALIAREAGQNALLGGSSARLGDCRERCRSSRTVDAVDERRSEVDQRRVRDRVVYGVRFRRRHRHAPVPSGIFYYSVRGDTGFGNRVVLIPGSTADTDGPDDPSVLLERDAAGEDHDASVVGGMNPEELAA
jgi:hypothetical protein